MPTDEDQDRALGWFVERDGRRMALLTDRTYVDMFWYSYRVEPLGVTEAERAAVYTRAFWLEAGLVFRDRATGRVAPHTFPGGVIPTREAPLIAMRALYLESPPSLHTRLAGRYRVFSPDLRVRAVATGLACYPDVTVVCGKVEADPESKDTVANPTMIVEVLSPATIDYDLGEKFEHYRRIPPLKAVVFLWQDRRQIEVRTRTTPGDWRSDTFGPGTVAQIEALGCGLDVDAIYASAGG